MKNIYILKSKSDRGVLYILMFVTVYYSQHHYCVKCCVFYLYAISHMMMYLGGCFHGLCFMK